MFDQITLPNGLQVIGEKLSHVRSCTFGCMVHVGSRNEAEDENGLSHFIEHMVFKGTQNRTAKQIAEEMDMVGGQMNAFTAKEYTCYYAKVTDDQLPLAVDIISDMVLRPAFDATELEKERGVILEEIAMCEDTPDDLVIELLAETQYSASLSLPILGTEEKILHYSQQDLIRYWKKHYRADRMVIAVSGNYDWDILLKLIDRYFNRFPVSEKTVSVPEPSIFLPKRISKNKDIEQLHIAIGYPGVKNFTQEQYVLTVLSNLLGGGMSSRLYQRIREELGLVYTISSFSSSYFDLGSFNIYAATTTGNGQNVISEIQKEIKRLLMDGIDEKEFVSAKNQLRVGYILGLESSSGRMQSIGRSLLLYGKVNQPEDIIAHIDAVTSEAVLQLAHTVLESKNSASLVGRNADSFLHLL